MKYKLIDRFILAFIVFDILIVSTLMTSYALFSGSHTLYLNKSTPVEFCNKCHPDKVTTLNLVSNAHRSAGCICHGYNPNATDTYNINVAHNLSKNIYCTNCHTNYDVTTGNITIHENVIAPNQSAHYLISDSNKPAMYQHAKEFFNNSKR